MYFDELITRFLQRLIHLGLLLLFLLFLYHYAFPLLIGLGILILIGFGLYVPFHSAFRSKRKNQLPLRSHRLPVKPTLVPVEEPTKPARPRIHFRELFRRWFPTIVEAICGAGVGWLIVQVRNQQVPDQPLPLLGGVAVGAFLGWVVSGWTKNTTENLSEGEDAEAIN